MIILKIGGGESLNIEGIVKDLSLLTDKILIVHGANALRDELGESLGIEKRVLKSVSGYSSVYSDEKAIDLLMMAYAGLKNQRLVESLQKVGVQAIGLTGLDGRLIQGARNRGVRVQEGEKVLLVRDFSGKPRSVNKPLLELLMQHGYVPVISVPIADESGFAINSENDDIVALLKQELEPHTVIQLIEAKGFLDDVHDPDSVIPNLNGEELRAREAAAEGRIKRKLHAIAKLLEGKPCRIILADGRVEHPINDALAGKGTQIR